MPQQPISFGDGVQKLVGILAQMELAPDADETADALIAEIRSSLVGFVRSMSQGAASPDMGPGAIPGTLDLGGGMDMGMMGGALPVEEAGLSRGPTPSPDMGAATEELRRVMSGA